MIHPTCAEVLATIQTGFDEQIVPHLHDNEARSAAATIGHLLRHVALRIADEGQILHDDVARLEALLARIADWLEQVGEGEPSAIRAVVIDRVPPEAYPSLAVLADRALALRGVLVAAQEALHRLAATHGSDPVYGELRQAVRDYIAAQLADEARLIAPAFQGKGPRR
jgi:hypothetical protein